MGCPFFILNFSRTQCLLFIGEAVGLVKPSTVFLGEDCTIPEFLAYFPIICLHCPRYFCTPTLDFCFKWFIITLNILLTTFERLLNDMLKYSKWRCFGSIHQE